MRWRESGSTWTYTFLDCTTKNPVLITFSNGGYSWYRLWRWSLAIFGLNTQKWGNPPHSAFTNTESLHLIFLTAFPSSPQTADNGSATSPAFIGIPVQGSLYGGQEMNALFLYSIPCWIKWRMLYSTSAIESSTTAKYNLQRQVPAGERSQIPKALSLVYPCD
jgi:hypothetical protein